MDNLMQNRDEMQDEELYALLDKSFDTERLCVSEELIQKTLKRVAETGDSKVISFEKAAKRKLPAVKYISVAAAALFVAVLGVGVLRGGTFSSDTKMEAAYDNMGQNAGAKPGIISESSGILAADSADGNKVYYHSTNDAQDMTTEVEENEAVVKEDRGASKTNANGVDKGLLECDTVSISTELTEALTAVGAEPVSGEAEYWEFVQRDTIWEKELFRELAAAMDVFGELLPETGAYSYSLECSDGSRRAIHCEYPLDGIVRIETAKGTLWGLLGEKTRFYAE